MHLLRATGAESFRAWTGSYGRCSGGRELRVMVGIDAGQGLRAHRQELTGLPDRDACLHQPRRRRMPQGVRDHLAVKASPFHGVLEASVDLLNTEPVIVDDIAQVSAPSPRTYEVRQQAIRYPHFATALVGAVVAE